MRIINISIHLLYHHINQEKIYLSAKCNMKIQFQLLIFIFHPNLADNIIVLFHFKCKKYQQIHKALYINVKQLTINKFS